MSSYHKLLVPDRLDTRFHFQYFSPLWLLFPPSSFVKSLLHDVFNHTPFAPSMRTGKCADTVGYALCWQALLIKASRIAQIHFSSWSLVISFERRWWIEVGNSRGFMERLRERLILFSECMHLLPFWIWESNQIQKINPRNSHIPSRIFSLNQDPLLQSFASRFSLVLKLLPHPNFKHLNPKPPPSSFFVLTLKVPLLLWLHPCINNSIQSSYSETSTSNLKSKQSIPFLFKKQWGTVCPQEMKRMPGKGVML